MPNKDANHDIVVRALKKDNWQILREQQYISIGTIETPLQRLYIDIKAQQSENLIVFIEVKGHADSPIHALMQIIGQYIVYRTALDYLGNSTLLYVAVPDTFYNTIMLNPLGQEVIQKMAIPFMIYNLANEEILQWIPPL